MREELFKNCTLCPRKCNVNRLEGKRGYCGMDSTIRAARAALHMWEEPCISCLLYTSPSPRDCS